MRDDTRRALIRIAKFLSDTAYSATSGNAIDFVTEAGATDVAEALDTYSQSYQLLKDMATRGGADEEVLPKNFDSAPSPSFFESWLESVQSPFALIGDQVLGAQGVHQPYYALRILATIIDQNSRLLEVTQQTVDEMPAEQVEAANEKTKSEEDEAQLSANDGEEDPETQGILGDEIQALDTLFGGFEFTGHNSWMASMPDTIKSLIPTTILEADQENPRKGNTTFCYAKFCDPTQYYSRAEGQIAGLAAMLVPSVEWSRASPYLNVQVLTRTRSTMSTSKAGETTGFVHPMSLDNFLRSGIRGAAAASHQMFMLDDTEEVLDFLDDTSGENKVIEGTAAVGMEVFTSPQTLVPMDQDSNAAFTGRGGYNSIDKARPFMTLKDFSMSVTPTGGAGSSQRAILSIILHDRGRLKQAANFLQPGTLNRTEFDIEWGWSHPSVGYNPLSGEIENMYGMFINSLRQQAKFTLYQTNYSFTADGQIELKLHMVTKGVTALNDTDTSTNRLILANQAVAAAKEAVDIASESLSPGSASVPRDEGDLQAQAFINSMTLDTVGNMISGESAKKLQAWIDKAKSPNGDKDLEDLADALTDLQQAVESSVESLHKELSTKITALNGLSYNQWKPYVQGTIGQDQTTPLCYQEDIESDINNILGSDWRTATGKFVPLAALIQLFVVHPIFTKNMYDEVQLITYTANLNAGAVSGANLGSLPIYIGKVGNTSFLDIMKKQYENYGGQYPVSRFMDWFATNYVDNQVVPMYGIKKADAGNLAYNESTGTIIPSKSVQKNLAAVTKQQVNLFNYGDTSSGTAEKPRKALFSPIKLKLYFEVAAGRQVKTIDGEILPETSNLPNMSILRIHVIDANVDASGKGGWLQVLASSRESGGKLIVVPEKRAQIPGMPDSVNAITNFEQNYVDADKVTQFLSRDDVGVLAPVIVDSTTTNDDIIANETRQAEIESDIALLDLDIDKYGSGDTANPIELKAAIAHKAALEAELENLNSAIADTGVYRLAANPTKLVDVCSAIAPNIVYGSEGSMVKNLSIKEKSNSKASTTYMMQALRGANSDDPFASRGVPMRVNAADVSISSFGNPSYKFMQRFFVHANTGTTIDNLYAVVGIEHKVSKDEYSTELTMAPLDAYGTFKSLADSAQEAKQHIDRLIQARTDRENALAKAKRDQRSYRTHVNRSVAYRKASDSMSSAVALSETGMNILTKACTILMSGGGYAMTGSPHAAALKRAKTSLVNFARGTGEGNADTMSDNIDRCLNNQARLQEADHTLADTLMYGLRKNGSGLNGTGGFGWNSNNLRSEAGVTCMGIVANEYIKELNSRVNVCVDAFGEPHDPTSGVAAPYGWLHSASPEDRRYQVDIILERLISAGWLPYMASHAHADRWRWGKPERIQNMRPLTGISNVPMEMDMYLSNNGTYDGDVWTYISSAAQGTSGQDELPITLTTRGQDTPILLWKQKYVYAPYKWGTDGSAGRKVYGNGIALNSFWAVMWDPSQGYFLSLSEICRNAGKDAVDALIRQDPSLTDPQIREIAKWYNMEDEWLGTK